MELKEVLRTLFFIFAVLSVDAEQNSTYYNAAALLSKIFPLEQNSLERLHTTPKYQREPNESQDGSEDISQNTVFRNNLNRKKRRRQRHPDGFGNGPYPGNEGHFYERPTFASEALSRLTEALTSIALYDDYQCVPRLLCEAGGGALGGSSVLPTGLQPLLTLLSAYSGVSSNPLFVFGRAVFLGMSSKENPGSCRYAYPQCPTDPEQLVYYLNNHNGGFFRFFNAPQKGQQNLQQFYNHLQNYQYGEQNGQQYQNNLQDYPQHYGLQNGQHYQNNLQEYPQYYGQQNGEQYQTNLQDYQQQNGQQNQNYGLYQQQNNLDVGYGFQKPNPYLNYENNYGFAFPYNNRNKNDFKIEKRIQNKPNSIENNDFFINNNNGKLNFPENSVSEGQTNIDFVKDTRSSKTLKFPDIDTNYYKQEYNRKTRGFVFPNSPNYYTNYNQLNDDNFVRDNKAYNYNYNFVKDDKANNYNYNDNDNNGYVTVYVVRGNGDPNRPEIVKLRPGQSL